jgi:hypothetical protein
MYDVILHEKKNIDFHSYTNTDQLNEREWWTVNNHKTKTFDIFVNFLFGFFVIFLFLISIIEEKKTKQIHK